MVEGTNEWGVKDGKLFQRFEFADFAAALAFVNKVGALAEAENHHPDIALGWGYAEVSLFTHSEDSVTAKDHALAVKIAELPRA